MSVAPGAPHPRLVADVGGTRARFGWVEAPGAAVGRIATYATGDHAGLAEALDHYLAEQQVGPPASAAIGVASPIGGDTVAMTNCRWTFSGRDLQRRFGLVRLLLMNDFEALAQALPTLLPGELVHLGGRPHGQDGAARAVLGPGTGLGVAGLLDVAGAGVPVVGEGGHVSLGAATPAEDCVVALLREQFGHVSAERVLSGAGLVNLYRASCVLAGEAPQELDPAELTARARHGTDGHCHAAVEWFFGFLGSVAGDLALTLGARGGVYVAGGIVGQLGDWIERSQFRARFEAKGRYRAYLSEIPTWLIRDPILPALRGADRALDATR